MGETKRQHYVPVCYLKNFSEDGIRVHAFLKKHNLNKLIGIHDLCCEKDFYTIDSEFVASGKDKLELENEYWAKEERALIEVLSYFSSLYERISNYPNSSTWDCTKDEKHKIARSITKMFLRGKRVRNLSEAYFKYIENLNPNKLTHDKALFHARQFYTNEEESEELIADLVSGNWTLFISENNPFITSDNPVCVVRPNTTMLGILGEKPSITYFPVSSNMLIEIKLESNRQSFVDSAVIAQATLTQEMMNNNHQFLFANNFVISKDKGHLIQLINKISN